MRVSASMESLWRYIDSLSLSKHIDSLSLSKRNREWLAGRLLEELRHEL